MHVVPTGPVRPAILCGMRSEKPTRPAGTAPLAFLRCYVTRAASGNPRRTAKGQQPGGQLQKTLLEKSRPPDPPPTYSPHQDARPYRENGRRGGMGGGGGGGA